MKISYLKITGLAFLLVVYSSKIFGQARSSISFGYGVNKPFSYQYNSGNGFKIQGDIALTDKVAISPALSYEGLNSARHIYPNTSYYDRVDDVTLTLIGASGSYYFTRRLFASLGPALYVAGGNEDIVGLGIGGTFAAGYNMDITSIVR